MDKVQDIMARYFHTTSVSQQNVVTMYGGLTVNASTSAVTRQARFSILCLQFLTLPHRNYQKKWASMLQP